MPLFIYVMNTRILQGRKLIWVSMALTVGACGKMDGAADDVEEPIQLALATNCAAPPEGTDPEAVAAYDRVNAYRKAAGLGCTTFNKEIAKAAADHCDYYTANSRKQMCISNPHREVEGCDKFHGERSSARLKDAMYTGMSAYEDMTYVGKGSKAVDMWVDSVWHRIPVLSPWVGDAGYGRAKGCDTMDFGWSSVPSEGPAVMWPYDGQAGIPRKWDGSVESPALPVPPRGWPSGYPIMLYMAGLKVTSHQLLDDAGMPVDHTFLAPGDKDSLGILLNEFAMYSHEPLEKKTTYKVVIEGTRKDQPVHVEWSFTTK
jgi:uncharacterized protein YkwD